MLASKVRIPAHSNPVELKALDIKLGRNIFKRIGRAHIVLPARNHVAGSILALTKTPTGLRRMPFEEATNPTRSVRRARSRSQARMIPQRVRPSARKQITIELLS